MKERKSKLALVVALFLAGAASMLLNNEVYSAKPVPPPPPPLLPHANLITSYTGPATCLGCHPSTIADEIFGSVHFQVRSESAKMDIPGGGAHGMMDRACGLPGTTMMANNWAGTAISPVDGITTRDDGCGKCHIAYNPPQSYASSAEAMPDLDCLRCHAKVYGDEWTHQENIALYGSNPDIQERHVVTLEDGSKIWTQDRSLMSAQSVGEAVSVEACLRCHEHGLSGYKRATPFTPETDLHANKGMLCTQCHTVLQHKIARGNYVTDGMATDLPDIEVECINCHSSTTPHAVSSFSPYLNRHIKNVTCETCHIHQMEETNRNIHRRAWAPFTMDPSTGTWDITPATTNGLEYPDFWDAYTEYLPATNARPDIRWFNGGASMLAQPYGSFEDRRSNGGDARLFAFKPFVSGMLFDAGWLPGPQSDPSFDPLHGTWPFSMKYFYEANWAKFLQFGFIDSQYPTPADYFTARPDMAAMLNNFPMMLQFSRPIYLAEAGTVVGTPTVGPQSAATYPGVAKAINNGMGTMVIDMGYFPPETDPEMAGAMMWSGSFFGMWVPMNMDQASSFYGEVTSYITMSHAITSNTSTTVDYCYACHYSREEYDGSVAPSNKYLSYGELGYDNLDANPLIDPMYDAASEYDCYDGIDNDNDGLIDFADPDCNGVSPAIELNCMDTLDDDGDGLTDCADPDCLGVTGCVNEVKGLCTDGIDNDNDGLTDCADPGCAKDNACR
ncbi:MAG: hypothetical protein KKD73_10090 [Proteobacteria bacterium]|nr:hypothetical protein [Pseudomonadota bacterium]MBU1641484.1 hypothetical protein [Pseudomonadota bacterium]